MSPELVLLCHVLQPSKHLGSSPWNFHQYDNDFHSVKSKTGHGTPDAVSRAEGWTGVGHENHLPPPAGYTLANTAIGCPHRLWSPYPWSYLKTQMDVVLEDLLQVTLFEPEVDKTTSRGQDFYETSQDPAANLCCKGTLLIPVQLLHWDAQVFFSKAAPLAIIFHFR